MCTAVRILVAASSREGRLALRRASVTAEWEVVGEAADADTAVRDAVELRARFLVIEAGAAGPRPEVAVRRLKSLAPTAFVVGVGDIPGADASVDPGHLDGLRDAMAGLLHDSGDHSHG